MLRWLLGKRGLDSEGPAAAASVEDEGSAAAASVEDEGSAAAASVEDEGPAAAASVEDEGPAGGSGPRMYVVGGRSAPLWVRRKKVQVVDYAPGR